MSDSAGVSSRDRRFLNGRPCGSDFDHFDGMPAGSPGWSPFLARRSESGGIWSSCALPYTHVGSLRGRRMARPRAGLLRSVQRRDGRVE